MSGADHIRSHYLNAGLSRRGFAESIGVHEQSIRRLEDGEGVHPKTAKKVADAVGCTVMDLLPKQEQAA